MTTADVWGGAGRRSHEQFESGPRRHGSERRTSDQGEEAPPKPFVRKEAKVGTQRSLPLRLGQEVQEVLRRGLAV